jgi:hypothetical protein
MIPLTFEYALPEGRDVPVGGTLIRHEAARIVRESYGAIVRTADGGKATLRLTTPDSLMAAARGDIQRPDGSLDMRVPPDYVRVP